MSVCCLAKMTLQRLSRKLLLRKKLHLPRTLRNNGNRNAKGAPAV